MRGECSYVDCPCTRYVEAKPPWCGLRGSPRLRYGAFASPADIVAGEMECPECGRLIAVGSNGGIRKHREPRT